ncbi:hypothetical protein [Halobacillus salinus]|uniref:Uncharacterized protein n=1 Tax=Halobacillus salinus TaxID=192814 RepID=A0A4Z0H3I3_9BACI|nr:hypothetical protein [Halobacillus salinus]TGB04454.1 hypothetical protein E4663_05525 [Halobacillus salinus]
MVYIVLGSVCIIVLIVLVAADKLATFSAMMSSFTSRTYKRLMVILSIATVAFLSYGIYYELTYQPPFLDISVDGEPYTVFGDIGELGYYSETLVYKGEQLDMNFVSWDKVDLSRAELIIEYPSGEEQTRDLKGAAIDLSTITVRGDVDPIQSVYRMEPITFIEEGGITVTVLDSDEVIGDFHLEVKRRENAQESES